VGSAERSAPRIGVAADTSTHPPLLPSGSFVIDSPAPVTLIEKLDWVHHLDGRPSQLQTCADLHRTSRIPGGQKLGARAQNRVHLVASDLTTQIRMRDSIDSRAPAAFFPFWDEDEIDARDGAQEIEGRRADPLAMK
jgi:hypothetical protein